MITNTILRISPKLLLICALTIIFFPTCVSYCFQDDMGFETGFSLKERNVGCASTTSYNVVETICGDDEEFYDEEYVVKCEPDVPYCIQCNWRGFVEALCVNDPLLHINCNITNGLNETSL